jgi:hypothetical protein
MSKLAIPKTKSPAEIALFLDGDGLPATDLRGGFLMHQQAVAVRGRSTILLRVRRLSSVYASRMTHLFNGTTVFGLR